jgi:hypothetical protein
MRHFQDDELMLSDCSIIKPWIHAWISSKAAGLSLNNESIAAVVEVCPVYLHKLWNWLRDKKK